MLWSNRKYVSKNDLVKYLYYAQMKYVIFGVSHGRLIIQYVNSYDVFIDFLDIRK